MDSFFKQTILSPFKKIFYYEGHSVFFPFAFKAGSTTLVVAKCITFHQTNLFDVVRKVLAFSPAISDVFGMLLSIPLIY